MIWSSFSSSTSIARRLEQETLQLVDFIRANVGQAFLSNVGNSYKQMNSANSLNVLSDIETVVECLIIFSHHIEPEEVERVSYLAIAKYFDKEVAEKSEKVAGKNQTAAKAAPKPSFDAFEDMMGGDSSEGDLMDFDFTAPKRKITDRNNGKAAQPDSTASNEPEKLSEAEIEYNSLVRLFGKTYAQLQRVLFKIKCTLILYLSLFVLAARFKKFNILADLLTQEHL